MGWKAVKEHYQIGHIVHMQPQGLCIGSGYIPDLIVVGPDGQLVKKLDSHFNKDLSRYQEEMLADPAKLRELLETPDQFARSIPVYTYKGAEILEKHCEALGYPNITHDGDLQYDNTYSGDRDQVVRWAKRSAALGAAHTRRWIEDLEKKLEEARNRLRCEETNLSLLETAHPSLEYERSEDY